MKDREISEETLAEGKPRVVILGSFRFNEQINSVIEYLEESGIEVLAPRRGMVINEKFGIKFLDTDSTNDPVELEKSFIEALTRSDALYIVNPEGYHGFNVGVEIGVGMTLGKPIYSMAPIDQNIYDDSPFWEDFPSLIKVFTPEELADMINSKNLETEGYFWLEDSGKSIDLQMIENVTKTGMFFDLLNKGDGEKLREFLQKSGGLPPGVRPIFYKSFEDTVSQIIKLENEYKNNI